MKQRDIEYLEIMFSRYYGRPDAKMDVKYSCFFYVGSFVAFIILVR